MKSLRALQFNLSDRDIQMGSSQPTQSSVNPIVNNYNLQQQQQEKKKEDPLKHPFQMKKMEIKDPEYMSEVPNHLQNKEIPGFPTVVLSVGKPGSGKTNVLINLLTRPDMWKGFFDRIYLLGPTIKSDKLYQHLELPDDQKVTEPSEFISKLMEWTEKQVQEVEQDAKEAPKTLFIFEDITSYYHTIQNDPIFIKCFNTIRHHKATAYVNIHKVKALNRTARMSCQHVLLFPVNKTEIDVAYNDWGPQTLSRLDFYHLCIDAWTPDEFNKKPFLYINNHADEKKRFRKCFTHIIDVKHYEGIHKLMESDRKDVREGKQPKRQRDSEDPQNQAEEDSQGNSKRHKPITYDDFMASYYKMDKKRQSIQSKQKTNKRQKLY